MSLEEVLKHIRPSVERDQRFKTVVHSDGRIEVIDTKPRTNASETKTVDYQKIKQNWKLDEITSENALEAFKSPFTSNEQKIKALFLLDNPEEHVSNIENHYNSSPDKQNFELLLMLATDKRIDVYTREDIVTTLYTDELENSIEDDDYDPTDISETVEKLVQVYHLLLNNDLVFAYRTKIITALICSRCHETSKAFQQLEKLIEDQRISVQHKLHTIKGLSLLLTNGEFQYMTHIVLEDILKKNPYLTGNKLKFAIEQVNEEEELKRDDYVKLDDIEVNDAMQFILALNMRISGNSDPILTVSTTQREALTAKRIKFLFEHTDSNFQHEVQESDTERYYSALYNIAMHPNLPTNCRADAADMLLRIPKYVQVGANIISMFANSVNPYESAQTAHYIDVSDIADKLSENPLAVNLEKDWGAVCKILLKDAKALPDASLFPKIARAIIRISIDSTRYTKQQWTSRQALMRVWHTCQSSENSNDMIVRLLEELAESADTCSSGHFVRILNSLSGFQNFSSTLSFAKAVQFRIRYLLNEEAANDDNLLLSLANPDALKDPVFKDFIRNKLGNIVQQVKQEYLVAGYTDTDIDETIVLAVRLYMMPGEL